MTASIADARGDASLISFHAASDSSMVGPDLAISRLGGLSLCDDFVRFLNRGDGGRSVGFGGRSIMVEISHEFRHLRLTHA